MNPQFAKEFRAIRIPWIGALVLAVAIPVANFLVFAEVADLLEYGPVSNFVLGASVFAFFASLLAIAAMPIGAEFHHRTLPLLLSQSVPRSRVWRQKLAVMTLGIGSALLVSAITAWTLQACIHPFVTSVIVKPTDVISVPEIEMAALSLFLPTIGSVTYWTLLARSTLGGMVFTAFPQLFYFGIVAFIAERGFGMQNAGGTVVFTLAGAIYGAVFFGLSWRKFRRLQITQLLPDTLVGSNSLSGQRLRLGWLRCRPSSCSFNLFRKEVQLQKPLFMIAAILCVLWALTYTFLILQPYYTTFPEIVFGLTIGFYLPLMSLLAGAVSLGEEKNLGINAWHLTFPISTPRHWVIKLAVGFGVWLFLGVLLPFGLTRLGATISGSRLFNEIELESWIGISLFMTGVFAISFWAMTLFSNTVRAVIGSIATVVGLCSAAALAYWLTVSLVMHQTILRTLLIYDSQWQNTRAWILLGGTTVVLALFQSLRQFQSLQASAKTIVRCVCALIVFIFLATTVYYLLLPIVQFAQPIYLLLFIVLLLILRRRGAPVSRRMAS